MRDPDGYWESILYAAKGDWYGTAYEEEQGRGAIFVSCIGS